MNPQQTNLKPTEIFGGDIFFKCLFDEESWDVDTNLETLIKYLKYTYNNNVSIDGIVLSTMIYFEDGIMLFMDDAKKYEFNYYLFPIRRIDAYLRLNQLKFKIQENVKELGFSISYDIISKPDMQYGIDDKISFTIKDETIPNWKRILKQIKTNIINKTFTLINKILPRKYIVYKYRKSIVGLKYNYRFRKNDIL